ncbi:hypothetical protein [Novosphingobium olei]|uniref:hypothetical protein n=1 Tax=Novosphingobium olei TaxID=2728851 RepID=UPI003087360A|nr:hypothetical protein NSDW_12110 [Novosphingobium olei]
MAGRLSRIAASQAVAPIQAMLALVLFALATGYPFAGRAAVAIPFAGETSRHAITSLSEGAQILGQSSVGGWPVVKLARSDAAFSALQHGWLLIAVPSTLCALPKPKGGEPSRTSENG